MSRPAFGLQSVLYEVAIKVEPEIRSEFLAWLTPHMDAMLALDGFLSAEAFVNREDENEIVCFYRLRDEAAMNAYLEGPAAEMRADGLARFGSRMRASRRILQASQP